MADNLHDRESVYTQHTERARLYRVMAERSLSAALKLGISRPTRYEDSAKIVIGRQTTRPGVSPLVGKLYN